MSEKSRRHHSNWSQSGFPSAYHFNHLSSMARKTVSGKLFRVNICIITPPNRSLHFRTAERHARMQSFPTKEALSSRQYFPCNLSPSLSRKWWVEVRVRRCEGKNMFVRLFVNGSEMGLIWPQKPCSHRLVMFYGVEYYEEGENSPCQLVRKRETQRVGWEIPVYHKGCQGGSHDIRLKSRYMFEWYESVIVSHPTDKM